MNNAQNDNRQIETPGRHRAPAIPGRDAAQTGAANVSRHQIEHIYNTDPPHQTAQPQAQELPATYNREHSDASAYNWRQYHTAWQNYYQQYYHRYYSSALQQEQQKLLEQKASTAASSSNGIITGINQAAINTNTSASAKLREELLEKVKIGAKKARSSSHFWPVVTALGVGLAFFLLQFNKVLAAQVSAFVSPSTVVSDNIITDPNASPVVGPEPKLVIPKINVDVPVVYGLNSLADGPTQTALEQGAVHYPIPGANNLPGETGNSVYMGHSSNEVFARGNYKFIFVRLDAMQPGDTFYMHYQSKRYIYRVTEKKVITPTQINELVRPTDKPLVTLVTCTPIGTATNRLLVFAEQISPDPSEATQGSNNVAEENKNTKISAGQAPNFLQQLFGF
ncbi:MAG TPA: sortase [Candidatus Saccharimonadales bacterium]